MLELRESETFRRWRLALKDRRARVLIAARLDRFAAGHAGDVKPVGGGVSELRIHHGPVYRIYFKQRNKTVVLLLCAGEKSTQAKDILTAKRLAEEWSTNNE